MIEVGKVPCFLDQLKFNLDASTPVSSANKSLGSPKIIFMQKLPQNVTVNKYEAIHRVPVIPMSPRLAIATQLAKIDVKNVGEAKCAFKQSKTMKTVLHHEEPANKKFLRPQLDSNACIKFKPSVQSQKKTGKVSKDLFFDRFRPIQNNLNALSIRTQPNAVQHSHAKPVKDAFTSTNDLLLDAVPSKLDIIAKRSVSPFVKIEKLDKSFSQRKSTRPCPKSLKKKPARCLHSVKQKSLIKKSNKNGKHFARPPSPRQDRQLTFHAPFETNKLEHQLPEPQDDSLSSEAWTEAFCNECDAKKRVQTPRQRTQLQPNRECVQTAKMDFNQVDYLRKTINQRLLDMEDAERSIRMRWKEIRYDDLHNDNPSSLSALPVEASLVDIAGGKTTVKAPKKEAVRFVKPEKEQVLTKFYPQASTSSSKLLFLSDSTVDSVFQNKSKFSDYLYTVFHKPVGKFNPWKIVNDLSEQVVNQIVSEVCNEVNEGFEGCVEHLFESEFAVPETQFDSV